MILLGAQEIPKLDEHEGLTQFFERKITVPPRLSITEYRKLSESERDAYNEKRLDYLGSDQIVETPQVKSVVMTTRLTAIHNRQRAIGRFGIIVSGPSNMGKTTMCLAAATHIYRQYEADMPDFRRVGRIPVVYVEVPSGSTGRGLMARFAEFLGYPVRDGDRLEDLKRVVVPHLNHAGTRLVIIDELHNLTTQNNGTRETSDVIKSLQNQVAATFMLSGMNIHEGPLVAGLRGQQLAGRSTAQILSPFTLATEQDRKIWKGIVASFESRLCLLNQAPGSLAKEARFLHLKTHGMIGALSRLLTSASGRLIVDSVPPEDEVVTRELLEPMEVDLGTDLRIGPKTAKTPGALSPKGGRDRVA